MKEQHGPGFPIRRASLPPEELERLQSQEAVRHRAEHHAGLHPEDGPYMTAQYNVQQRRQTDASRTSHHVDVEEDERDDSSDKRWSTRLPSSSRRYYTTAGQQVYQQGNTRYVIHDAPPPRRKVLPPHSSQREEEPEPLQRARRRIRLHWSVYLGLGMIVMIFGWLAFTTLSNWWQTTQDDWHYSRPRTFQIDAVVGHHDSQSNPSHLIALNLDRHVIVIELPGGDPSKAVIYSGPVLVGEGQDLTPVTLTFKDVNGDGKTDMLVHILDQTIVYLNDGTRFSPVKPGEQATL
ncbi:MAG: hypothetical protein ACRDIV_23850 [Ktedonobacteraceae bacterium]